MPLPSLLPSVSSSPPRWRAVAARWWRRLRGHARRCCTANALPLPLLPPPPPLPPRCCHASRHGAAADDAVLLPHCTLPPPCYCAAAATTAAALLPLPCYCRRPAAALPGATALLPRCHRHRHGSTGFVSTEHWSDCVNERNRYSALYETIPSKVVNTYR